MLDALQAALKTRQPEIQYSDQGVQAAATAVHSRVARTRDSQISMAEVGEPTQYGYAERLARWIRLVEVWLKKRFALPLPPKRVWPMAMETSKEQSE